MRWAHIMALSSVLNMQAMDNLSRSINPLDNLISGFDRALRVVGGVAKASRPNPGTLAKDCELNAQEARHSAGLMRVNHVGEVCAQALYDSQSRHAGSPAMRAQFQQAGREEGRLLDDDAGAPPGPLGGDAAAQRHHAVPGPAVHADGGAAAARARDDGARHAVVVVRQIGRAHV